MSINIHLVNNVISIIEAHKSYQEKKQITLCLDKVTKNIGVNSGDTYPLNIVLTYLNT